MATAARPFPTLSDDGTASRSPSPSRKQKQSSKQEPKQKQKGNKDDAAIASAQSSRGEGEGSGSSLPSPPSSSSEQKPQEKVGQQRKKRQDNTHAGTNKPQESPLRRHKSRGRGKAGAGGPSKNGNHGVEAAAGDSEAQGSGRGQSADTQAPVAAARPSAPKHHRRFTKKMRRHTSDGEAAATEAPNANALHVPPADDEPADIQALYDSMMGVGLSSATIVAGENGRARVMFGRRASIAAPDYIEPSMGLHQPRFPRFPSPSHAGVAPLVDSGRGRSHTSAYNFNGLAAPQHYSAPQRVPRGRSLSVAMQNLTGTRISMAQPRPGNVLSPHVGMLATEGLPSPSSGYFGARKPVVGLAADPSHSIRIPAVMFQKPKDAGDVENVAMKRLQDMISSLKGLGEPSKDTGKEPAEATEAVEAVEEVSYKPTPHPSTMFDSILEEDEDDEAEEASLIAEEEQIHASGTASPASSSSPAKPRVLFAV